MTKQSGGDTIKRGPQPPPGDAVGELAGDVRRKGEDPSPGDRERGETSGADDCTAHDRAG